MGSGKKILRVGTNLHTNLLILLHKKLTNVKQKHYFAVVGGSREMSIDNIERYELTNQNKNVNYIP